MVLAQIVFDAPDLLLCAMEKLAEGGCFFCPLSGALLQQVQAGENGGYLLQIGAARAQQR